MPLPVAVDPHQNWLLLADVGPDLRSTPDSQGWAEATQTLPDAASARSGMLESYLGLWTAYEPLERLRQAWALAQPLAALHQAISFAHIVAGLEATAQHALAQGLAHWLRQVFQCLEPESPATGL